MITTVCKSEFHDRFNAVRSHNFTCEGLDALYEYFEQYEEECDTKVELDVIAMCCEYSEYTVKECCDNYDMPLSEIENNTMVIYIDDLGDFRNTDSIDNMDCRIIIADF